MLALWKESYDKPRQHIKKQRHHFLTKFHIVKAMVFPLVMYGYESWVIWKAEHQRINAFELRCWGRLLRVLWTASRSDQWILKDIKSEYSFGGLMLKLKLQSFGYLMWRTDSLEKTLMLCKVEAKGGGGRRWDGWIASLTQCTWFWANSRRQWRTKEPGRVHGVANHWTRLSDWTATAEWKSRRCKALKSRYSKKCSGNA